MAQINIHDAVAQSGTFLIGGDLKVHRLGFGAMRITGEGIWGPPANKQQAIHVLRRAIDLNINLIDTADSYGPEVSEKLIEEALYPYPQHLIIATKGGLERTGPNQWVPNGHPDHLRQALNGSLTRLKRGHIDVYQFHRPDPKVPYEDSIGELSELQAVGKIHHIGLSNVTIEQIETARQIVKVVSVQNRFNLTDLNSEDVLNYCEREGIAFIPWHPLATGELALPGSPLEAAAKKYNATPSQIALAWLLHRSRVMLPIPGTSSVEHLEENVLGAAIQLNEAEFKSISSTSK
ncbi:MAG TPA: aldo/keto reductase [Ktedonobacteraceae bacterium]|nr:aldo/keto reductase [Ktedonobacteraceae bacterium]